VQFASIALSPSVHNKRSHNTEEAERAAPCRSSEGGSSSHHDLHPMGGLRASPLSRPETPASSAKKQVLQLSMLTGRPVDIAGWRRARSCPRVQGCIPCPLSEPQSPHLTSTPGCCTRWGSSGRLQYVRTAPSSGVGGRRRRAPTVCGSWSQFPPGKRRSFSLFPNSVRSARGSLLAAAAPSTPDVRSRAYVLVYVLARAGMRSACARRAAHALALGTAARATSLMLA
jgi:hypothetical protein